MKKRFISVLLCLCFVCALLPIVDAHTNNHTSAEAVAWANSQIGIGLEYDGVHPYQCVDLIKYYYDYLGNASFASGNAIDYASNSLPDGWVRVYGDYQPGDIAVWYANHSCSTCSTGPYGHVGIITAVGSYQFDAVNQNFNSQAYCTKNTFNISALLCAIRPDFSGGVIATMDWTEEICNPTETSAYISIKAVPNVSGSFGECGITIKDADTGAVVGRKTETADPTAKTYLILYYYVTEELGVVLTPGKSYTYQFYTYFNGTRYDSPVGSFTTPHTHSYLTATTPPTCTEQGYTTHTCSICGDSYVDTYVPALGHDIVKDAAVAPTCTATGLTAGEHCTRCDYKVAQEVVPALGHTWNDGEITKPATETEDGVKTYTCTLCGVKKTEIIPATGEEVCEHEHAHPDHKDATCTEDGYDRMICDECGKVVSETTISAPGHNFVDGACTVCGAKDPNYKPAEPTKFNDVAKTAWYYDAVNYAVQNGLMNGVGGGNFAPDSPMTRAMLVTVLWRYEGSPVEGKNTFTDVPNGQWYTKAVAWAAHNGIVGGVGNGKFDPNGNITREQMAAILFRYADKKGFDTSKRGDLSGFPDRAKVSGYASDAIAWTVAKKIIGGSDGKLLPQGNATRAQVATILMRFIESIAKK